eukprot:CAMPEP_0172734846 /NCGR_PEP_ID=MMETSP1074-20121228/110967_1 /TAXON_ID=2916 /ORGANISM="Ceratium fusus, Strain PA161109" /LENGTH=53 /DNA_ID=CAMNT_0013563711 /DNA_START=124 /DNA_END=283 /DNA_ORIENTATION=+
MMGAIPAAQGRPPQQPSAGLPPQSPRQGHNGRHGHLDMASIQGFARWTKKKHP